jgi:polysaccharide deacetylase family protein (PEP-CTERM system associated)
LWALDVLLEEGYRYDASIFPVRHDRYGIPDAHRWPHAMTRAGGSLFEVPGSTVRLGGHNLPVAGGGYFRILPYAWTRWGIRRVNRVEGQPAVFYLHPWEIDPRQPRLPASVLGRFRHYRNLHRTEARLRSLMRDFSFGPLETVLAGCAA